MIALRWDHNSNYLFVYRKVLRDLMDDYCLTRIEFELLALTQQVNHNRSYVTTADLKEYYDTISPNKFYDSLRNLRQRGYTVNFKGTAIEPAQRRFQITARGTEIITIYNMQIDFAVGRLEEFLYRIMVGY